MTTLTKVRQYLQEADLDAFMITSPFNRRYTTNFTGSAGVVLITEANALLITDFRYIDQAESQAPLFEIIRHESSLVDEVKEQLRRLGAEKIAFESEHMTMAEYGQYKEKINGELIATKGVIEGFRLVKNDEEIAILKEAAKIADDAFEHILTMIKPGVRELDISNELEYFMRKKGASQSSFDTIVASGVRSSLPHGTASEKKIQEGELVTLDFGALYKGYCSDITRTVAVGKVDDELRKIYDIVLTAQENALAGIKPGITGKEADAFTRDYITEQGYGNYFGHSTGHGIGLEIHEGPSLAPRTETKLEKNMVVTVEPGIYLPNIGGCRIEDDIVLTETGNERLTLSDKAFIQL